MVHIYEFESTENIRELVLIRYICSWVSTIMCSFTLIMYITLLIRTSINPSERSSKSLEMNSKSNNSNKKGFGLGSHAMAVLLILNLAWSVMNIISCIIYPNGFIYELDKFLTSCPYLAFLHHFLDLSQVGWTSVISSLFLSSTKSRMITPEEGRDTFLRGVFFYTCGPLFFAGIPILTYSYGPSGQFCSFDAISPDTSYYFWFIFFQLYTWGYISYNIYAIVRVAIFYIRKLSQVKGHNKSEYNNMKIYVILFSFFPIILLLTRAVALIHSIILLTKKNEIFWIEATSGGLFALSGAMNSLLCIFFYRKAFMCSCCKKERSHSFTSQMTKSRKQEMTDSHNNSVNNSLENEVNNL